MGNYCFFHFYFLNINISVTIQVINLKFAICVLKYPVEGNFLHFFKTLISTFSQIKTRAYNTILRQASLHMDLMNAHLKF